MSRIVPAVICHKRRRSRCARPNTSRLPLTRGRHHTLPRHGDLPRVPQHDLDAPQGSGSARRSPFLMQKRRIPRCVGSNFQLRSCGFWYRMESSSAPDRRVLGANAVGEVSLLSQAPDQSSITSPCPLDIRSIVGQANPSTTKRMKQVRILPLECCSSARVAWANPVCGGSSPSLRRLSGAPPPSPLERNRQVSSQPGSLTTRFWTG